MQAFTYRAVEAFAELETQDGTAALTHPEWLALLTEREISSRATKRFQTRMRAAKLRHANAAPEDIDYRTRRNLIITGPCGVGKTWLACALAQKACRENVTVLYKRLPRMFAELEIGHGDGRFPRVFRSLTRVDLLILDDWGPERLNASQRRDLMEIVDDRYETGSTLITSQLPIDAWHDIIAEPTFADAILDRLVHNAYKLDLDGQSMRKMKGTTEIKPVDENAVN